MPETTNTTTTGASQDDKAKPEDATDTSATTDQGSTSPTSPPASPTNDGKKNIEIDAKKKKDSLHNEESFLLDGKPTRDVSNIGTFMNLFKALTGPSTMGMARVIANGGLITGSIGFLFIGFLNGFCNLTMVKCARLLEKRTGKSWFHYEEVVEGSFASFSDDLKWQRRALWARRLALCMLIFCQLGLLSFYYQILATTLKKEFETSFPEIDVHLVWIEFVVCICLLPYSWLRNLRILATFSTIANTFKCFSVVIVLQYALEHMKSLDTVDLVPDDAWTIPLFIGGSVFTLEGIAMVLPIENRIEKPDDYTGKFGIVSLATLTNIMVNLSMGVFGYLAFGNGVTGNILVSLPHEMLYRLVSMTYAGMVFLTFTLQLYQPAEAIYEILLASYPSDFLSKYGNAAVRSLLTVITFLFAALIPRVDLMMSLVGALNGCTLVFVFPIISELLLVHGEPGGISKTIWARNILLLVFGVLAFTTGTYTSLRDIIDIL